MDLNFEASWCDIYFSPRSLAHSSQLSMAKRSNNKDRSGSICSSLSLSFLAFEIPANNNNGGIFLEKSRASLAAVIEKARKEVPTMGGKKKEKKSKVVTRYFEPQISPLYLFQSILFIQYKH